MHVINWRVAMQIVRGKTVICCVWVKHVCFLTDFLQGVRSLRLTTVTSLCCVDTNILRCIRMRWRTRAYAGYALTLSTNKHVVSEVLAYPTTSSQTYDHNNAKIWERLLFFSPQVCTHLMFLCCICNAAMLHTKCATVWMSEVLRCVSSPLCVSDFLNEMDL